MKKKDRVIKRIMDYMAIGSPSGYTFHLTNEIKATCESLDVAVKETNKGALVITLVGENSDEERAVSAHLDTLGGIVKEITSNGRLRFHKIGGGSYSAIEGENCTIITQDDQKIRGAVMPDMASTHVHGKRAREEERTEDNMAIRIDEKVHSRSDVASLGIHVGDIIYYDTRSEFTKSGFLKSRYIDNKVAVGILMDIVYEWSKNGIRPKYTTHFILSNYEEVGHGLSFIPANVSELLALDIGLVGKGQTSDEYSVSITAKDKRTPYDYQFRKKLVQLCEKNEIDYNVDVYRYYSSDATQAIHRGCDLKIACIGPGTDSTHHYERTHVESIMNTRALISAYLKS